MTELLGRRTRALRLSSGSWELLGASGSAEVGPGAVVAQRDQDFVDVAGRDRVE